jgi:type II secretory pathway pseudopilin PulG
MNDEQLPVPPRKRRRARTILAVVAAVVVVGALAGIATTALLSNATLRSQVTAADARAANAETAAQAAAQKDYEARNAALNREAAMLNEKSQAIAAEIGELQANTIRAAGLYVVGHDIKSGTWHTAGDGSVSGGRCGYEVFSSANRPGNAIFFEGPWTVDLSGAYAFEIKGPCTWVRVPS